ncbi:MAG: hypothetical protein Q7J15_08155 [Candidatus Desulfaltia sp.]|nr:hypothetical protein [Candidatus Desulfaltia sp.]
MFEKVKAQKYLSQIEKDVKSCSQQIPIFNENRDFVEFEFMFFFYFVYDYRVYHKLKPVLRKAISDLFIENLHTIRESSLPRQSLDGMFDNRMSAFIGFIQRSKTVADFLDLSSDYLNVLLTVSIDENGYATGAVSDLPKIKKGIKPDIFTALIREALSLQSWTIL